MMISTIILNWNRDRLLQQTIDAYFTTVTGPSEMIIVDNASTDASRAVIEAAGRRVPALKSIFLPQNIGGKAINAALEQVSGELVHLCENDQVLLPGWSEHARDAYRLFPDLGQLSLFGVVPTDDEAWDVKPSHLRFAKGKFSTSRMAMSDYPRSCARPSFATRACGCATCRRSVPRRSGCPMTSRCRMR